MGKLLIVCGPTATGKTTLAAHLARKFGGELVSADSRQVYRGMDLVTGKDRPDVPVWLYDVVDPDEPFSVSHWVKLARKAIIDIQKRNKLPIVVGGTGLYIKALLSPIDSIDIPPDAQLRKRLENASVPELQNMVSRGSMNESDWNNPRRLIRKIEIAKAGKKKSRGIPYDALVIGLSAPLPELKKRIEERLQTRKDVGMEAEIASLNKKYDSHFPSMSAIGLNEYAYAKRQMTWFKKQTYIEWFDITGKKYPDEIFLLVEKWYTG